MSNPYAHGTPGWYEAEIRGLKEALVSAARSAEVALTRLIDAEMTIEAARAVVDCPTAAGLEMLDRAIDAYDAGGPS